MERTASEWITEPGLSTRLEQLTSDRYSRTVRPCLHLGSGCDAPMVLQETSPGGVQWFKCQNGHDTFVAVPR